MNSDSKSGAYRVPERFSLTAILVLTTTFAAVFGALRYANAPAVLYMFIGTEIVAICAVQMFFGSLPRGASTITGSLILPLWIFLTVDLLPVARLVYTFFPGYFDFFGIDRAVTFFVSTFVFSVLIGALLGYCVGALAAGAFLLMDHINSFFARHPATPDIERDEAE